MHKLIKLKLITLFFGALFFLPVLRWLPILKPGPLQEDKQKSEKWILPSIAPISFDMGVIIF